MFSPAFVCEHDIWMNISDNVGIRVCALREHVFLVYLGRLLRLCQCEFGRLTKLEKGRPAVEVVEQAIRLQNLGYWFKLDEGQWGVSKSTETNKILLAGRVVYVSQQHERLSNLVS